MNLLSFLDLMRRIYGSGLPDIERIQRKGLLAVKIAQHFALRIDFLDERVCRHLAQLYRHNLTLPAESIDALLARSVAPDWHERVRELERTALASASVGQVHRARLSDGSPVVVKVIKRDFKKAFLADIASLRRLLRAAIFVYPKLRKVFDPMGILEHIEDYTMNELDLRNEIAGQQILRGIRDENAGRYDLGRLRFHRLHEDLSGENVLVSEFVVRLDLRRAAREGRPALRTHAAALRPARLLRLRRGRLPRRHPPGQRGARARRSDLPGRHLGHQLDRHTRQERSVPLLRRALGQRLRRLRASSERDGAASDRRRRLWALPRALRRFVS